MMARPGRQLAQPEGAQFAAQRLLADRNAEFVKHPLRQVDQPPAHHAVNRRYRSALNDLPQRLPALIIERGALPGALPLTRPGGPSALNASTQSRTVCRPTPPSLAAAVLEPPSWITARQQAPGLRGIRRPLRQTAQLRRSVILPKANRRCHGKPLAFATVNHIRAGW